MHTRKTPICRARLSARCLAQPRNRRAGRLPHGGSGRRSFDMCLTCERQATDQLAILTLRTSATGASPTSSRNPVGELPYLYRELHGTPIEWWNPLELRVEVETWLQFAIGSAMCVRQASCLHPQDGVSRPSSCRTAMVGDPRARRSCPPSPAERTHLQLGSPKRAQSPSDTELLSTWQEIVDALVVAGDSRLARYSD